MRNSTLLAALDLGSNSFRLEIGAYRAGHIERVDYLKEMVRQGAGLDTQHRLNHDAMVRGWDCLARFAERLRGFAPAQVRAVATQTLREAHNREAFLGPAQQILGFPIEVVSGQEEGRLIYQGVSRLLPQSDETRLVVDIGGRSTELVLGQRYTPRQVESYHVGSVSWALRYFPEGNISAEAMATARVAAVAVLDEAIHTFNPSDWDAAYGSSGTVGAVAEVLAANGYPDGQVTRDGLDWLVQQMVAAGHASRLQLAGMSTQRRPVTAGGVSVLLALFEVLQLHTLHQANGALRQGALYDLIDRDSETTDVRAHSVARLQRRYGVDTPQAQRVDTVAQQLLQPLLPHIALPHGHAQRLHWAAQLHEVGAYISHERAHHHGAYVLEHTDAPGFALDELHHLGQLVLGQRGALHKIDPQLLAQPAFRALLLCLRLAVLLCHARHTPDSASVHLHPHGGGSTHLSTRPGWSQSHPQSAWLLQQEARHWQATDWPLHLTLA